MQSTGTVGGDTCRMVALVRAMAHGDEIALSSVYEQTAARVFGIAHAILGSREDAEEVVCDVYTYAWQHATTYDARRGTVAAWLAIMAKSRALDRRRKQRVQVSLDDTTHEPLAVSDERLNPEGMLCQIQARYTLHTALESLTPQRQQLIDLAFFQGLSHQELADATGMRLGTVKSHLRRALAVLQDRLAHD